MRLLKFGLIAALAVVTLLFGYAKFRNISQGVDQGPEISCGDTGVMEISVRDGAEVLLSGMTAYDAQDGDLTGQILVASVSQLVTEDTATVTYLVFDSHDNMARFQRTVRYTDYRSPRIQVDAPLIFTDENTVGLIGCLSAEDVLDGDITDRIRLSGLWATEYANVYSVSAMVSNSMGDVVQLELPVIVQEELVNRPKILLSRQIVYLDQGSGFDPMDYVKKIVVGNGVYPKDQLIMEHQVDTLTPGTYWVRYLYVCDSIQGMAILTVVVL